MIDLGTGHATRYNNSDDEWIDVNNIFEINAKSTATENSNLYATQRIVNYVISHGITASDYGRNIKYRINHTSNASDTINGHSYPNDDTRFDITGFNTLKFIAEGS